MTFSEKLSEFLNANAELRSFSYVIETEAETLRKGLLAIPEPLETDQLTLTLLTGHVPVLLNMIRPSLAVGALDPTSLLPSLVSRSLRYWRETNLEIFASLSRDRVALEERFGVLGAFTSISAPTGDFHRSGRAVRVLTFENGRQIVFKPRSLKVDRTFQDFLRWVNGKGLSRPLRTLQVFERGDYGWSEFVSAADCASMEEAFDFDIRIGALLAIFYVIGATDMHFQNILAAGPQPVAIDLETLFHRFPRHTEADVASATSASYLDILNSVHSVGLLPWPIPVAPEMWLDMGGVGGRFHPPGLMKRAAALNRPTLQGEVIEPNLSAIVLGFDDAYNLLVQHKRELLDNEGPLTPFRDNEVRVVVQGTFVYQQNLLRSYAPEFLRTLAARERYFEECFTSGPPGVKQFANSEKAQLMNGDVPSFTFRVDGETIHGADGSVVSNVAGKSGWETSHERLNQLSESEFQKQRWYLEASFGVERLRLPKIDSLAALSTTLIENWKSRSVRENGSVSWPSIQKTAGLPEQPLYSVVPAKAQDALEMALALSKVDFELALAAIRTYEEQISKEPLSSRAVGRELVVYSRLGLDTTRCLERLDARDLPDGRPEFSLKAREAFAKSFDVLEGLWLHRTCKDVAPEIRAQLELLRMRELDLTVDGLRTLLALKLASKEFGEDFSTASEDRFLQKLNASGFIVGEIPSLVLHAQLLERVEFDPALFVFKP